MIATVGPITTGGINLSIHSTPTLRIMKEITTYTRPAHNAPINNPAKPACTDTAPANAADMLPMNAKEEPKNTGLFFFVKAT